jgi:hypothetical protein
VSRFFISPTTSGSRTKFYSSVALFVFALLAAFEISQFVLINDWTGLGFIVIGIAGLAFAVRILNNWRHGLYIFFGWLFFEDFARKFLGNNMVIYFAKDVLVILVYISFYLARRKSREIVRFRPPFLLPLLIFFWFAAAQVLNPGASSMF